MAIFNTVGSALQSGASRAGINLKSIASGFGIINNTQNASNYSDPQRSTNMTDENIQNLMNVRKSVVNNGQNVLRYPPDIDSRYMTFKFYEYQRPNPLKQPDLKERNTIILPLPAQQLAENHDPIIEGHALGVFGAVANLPEAGEQFPSAAAGVGAMAAFNFANSLTPAINQNDSALMKGLKYAAQATGITGQNASLYAQQKLGVAPNPHPNYFFTGVSPRSHTFTWALAPRNEEESNIIREIVKTIRNNMLPGSKLGGNILTYPYLCKVSIVPDEYYYKFKTCFVDFLRASYSPQVFAKTKAPVGINITLALQEVEIMLSDRDISSDAASNLTKDSILNQAEVFNNAIQNVGVGI